MAAYQFKDDDVICSCTGFTKKRFISTIESEKITLLEQVREVTRVNKACGMCIYIVEKLLSETNSQAAST